jgi:hypothetical protein
MRVKTVAVALAATISISAGDRVRLPDPSTGVVEGKKAVAIWPADYGDGSRPPEPISPAGCSAHFVSGSDLNDEVTRPCGQWLRLKPGHYKVWAEGDSYISPTYWTLQYGDDPFDGKGLVAVIPAVPAGTVRLERALSGTDIGLRLLSLNAQPLPGSHRAFDRRVTPPASSSKMPIGKILAGLFDRRTGDAVALSRPFMVKSKEVSVVNPVRPASGSDVLVVLRKPIAAHEAKPSLTLNVDGSSSRVPDVVFHAADALFAVWYGVTGRSARLTTQSDRLVMPAVDLRLQPNRVVTYRGSLNVLPKLGVSINVPEGAFKTLSIEVRRLANRAEPVARANVRPHAQHQFEFVPAEPLVVTFKGDELEWEEAIDLSNGIDRDMTFDLDPITVTGTVYLGGEPAVAEVTFELDRKVQAKLLTGADGRYEAILWRTGLYDATVKLSGDPGQPFVDPVVDIEDDRTLDFRLPANRIVATIIDAVTTRPIPRATVGVNSQYEDSVRATIAIGARYETDDAGKLVLPRLRPGPTEIVAGAEGYEESEPQRFTIEPDTSAKEIVVALRPRDVSARITILLPDGRPALGAEACAFTGPTFQRAGCHSVTSTEGTLDAPGVSGNDGLMIVRHLAAGTLAVALDQLPDTLRLPPPAPDALVIHTERSTGETIPFALLTIWINGFRLTDVAAAYATWNISALTDSGGRWVARNLPASPVRVLATKRVSPVQIASGSYDSLATAVQSPWPAGTVPVRAVE